MTDCNSAPLIEIRRLTKIFGKAPHSALDELRRGMGKSELLAKTGHHLGLNNIDLEIKRGEIFVVMGLSGSGKSTLIRHVNRLIEPTAGNIQIDGHDILAMNDAELRTLRRQRLAMVFQGFALLPHQTVLDNVAYGLALQGRDKRSRQATARRWLDTVGLGDYHAQYPDQLSGGQQQRVGLARALATDADILLMDEAFSALDPLIRSEMQQQLLALQQQLHKTILFISHDLDEALRLGDRIAILQDGELSQVGAPNEILLQPANGYVANFVRDVNLARALTAGALMAPLTTDTPSMDAPVYRHASIESLWPQLLASDEPLLVIDEQNSPCGLLGRQQVAQLFAGNQAGLLAR